MVRGMVQLLLWAVLSGMDRMTSGLVRLRDLRWRFESGQATARSPLPPAKGGPRIDGAHRPAERRRRDERESSPSIGAPDTSANATRMEERTMSVDQDLSGDMIKVVQYTIISVATGIIDDARVLTGTKVVAFADDMTAADFTAWILSKCRREIHKWAHDLCEKLRRAGDASGPIPPEQILKNPKFHRVAYQVISRFSPADIAWDEAQAQYLGEIADVLKHHLPKKPDEELPRRDSAAGPEES